MGARERLDRSIVPVLPKVYFSVFFFVICVLTLIMNLALEIRFELERVITVNTGLTAAMIGILAIVFSIRILVVQNAVDRHTSALYRLTSRDAFSTVVFFVLAILAVYSLTLALMASSDSVRLNDLSMRLTRWSLVPMVGIALWLQYALYNSVRELVDPNRGIKDVSREAYIHLKRLSSAVRDLETIFQKRAEAGLGPIVRSTTAAAFLQLAPMIQGFGNSLRGLFDYHDKLIAQNERRLAREVLRLVSLVTCGYMEMRRTSTVLVPSDTPFASISDSQEFMTGILEEYLSRAKQYIRLDDGDGVSVIVWIFRDLMRASAPIKPVNDIQGENPIFSQCCGYLGEIVAFASAQNHIETLFQAARISGEIGSLAVDNKLSGELHSVLKLICDVAFGGIRAPMMEIWERCAAAYVQVVIRLCESERSDLKVFLNLIYDYIGLAIVPAINVRRILGTINTDPKMNELIDVAPSTLQKVIQRTGNSDEPLELQRSNLTAIVICECQAKFLRSLSEKIKSADDVLVRTVARSISRMGIMMLQLAEMEGWEKQRRTLLELVETYIYLPSWFVGNSEKIDTGTFFNDLPDGIARIGFVAAKENNEIIARMCVAALQRLSEQVLVRADHQYSFTAPRVMMRACLVGILLLKLGFTDSMEHVKTAIEHFERKYHQKWKAQNAEVPTHFESPLTMALQSEVANLREKCLHRPISDYRSLLGSAEDVLLSEIGVEDIENFYRAIWGGEISDSFSFRYL